MSEDLSPAERMVIVNVALEGLQRQGQEPEVLQMCGGSLRGISQDRCCNPGTQSKPICRSMLTIQLMF